MKVSIYFQNIRIFTHFGKVRRMYTCLILLLVCLLFIPNNLFSQQLQKKITIKLNSVPIKEALANIQAASGLQINYDGNIFNSQQKVNLNAENLSIESVLKQIFSNSNVDFKSAGNNTIVLYKLAQPQSQGRIIGTVVDQNGEPLVGANISVQGSGKPIMTDNKGNFIIQIKPGSYTLYITYVSHQSQRITEVKVIEGKSTSLNVALQPSANTLEQVTVTIGYKKASISGLLARQKNASEISNGISAEQISATPDQNIGESIKRISGVNTMNNKFVIVRGIGERYNSATLDGTLLPSTEAQKRSFSFDIIPTSIVENVIVAKSITADMNVSFGGGLIQINTKDIPTENFMSMTLGMGVNDQSTGKDFLSPHRGKYDYLSFDDGRRAFPTNLKPLFELEDIDAIEEQSKNFKNDNFTLYNYKAKPAQNYQFTIGRLYNLKGSNVNKLGFTGSLNYRNNQDIVFIEDNKRGKWSNEYENVTKGNSYEFNNTWGGLLNIGLQLDKHRFSIRNTMSRVFNNNLARIKGVDANNAFDGKADKIIEANVPSFTTLLQNKVTGQHSFDGLKIDWEFARSGVDRKDKDMGVISQFLSSNKVNGNNIFTYGVSNITEPSTTTASRHNYANKETNYSAGLSASHPIQLGKLANSIKTGYFMLHRQAKFDWMITTQVRDPKTFIGNLIYLPVAERFNPENISEQGFLYTINGWNSDYYKGKSQTHAGYLMLDHKWIDKLRFVWGIRAEYYEYQELKNPISIKAYEGFKLENEPSWRWFPSANLTYSPINNLNFRFAYSKTAIRPEMLENSQFLRYSAYYDGTFGSNGLNSTIIDSWDFKTEWYPGLGEIISLGAYYKYFDKPGEVTAQETPDYTWIYTLGNAAWAKVYGIEFELRKTLNFINDHPILNQVSIYGNATLQKGDVMTWASKLDSATNEYVRLHSKQSRSLYGQSPFLINVGLQYQGDRLGLNVVLNRSGRKTSFVSQNIYETEFELPRSVLDAQISYKFLHNKLELKVNASNLLNTAAVFYNNQLSYDYTKPEIDKETGLPSYPFKPGNSLNLDKDDRIFYKQKFGRTYSTSLTYKF